MLCKMGEFEEAHSKYKKALAICEKAHGADHPDVAVSLVGLARVFYETGKPAQAEPLLARALKIRTEKLGADHPHAANTQEFLTLVLSELGRKTEL